MSTKTTFKRVALVAVASLGLGIVSAVPSNAAVSGITITVVNGTKIAGSGIQETTSGATVSVTGLIDKASDSIAITITPKTVPSGQASVVGQLLFIDTVVSGATVPTADTVTVRHVVAQGLQVAGSMGSNKSAKGYGTGGTIDSIVAWSGSTSARAFILSTVSAHPSSGVSAPAIATNSTSTGYVSGAFRLALDTSISATLVAAGTYTYTITATPYSDLGAGTSVTADVSIVASSPTISGSTSTAYIGTSTGNTSDASATALTAAATASNSTAAGYVTVTLKDADGKPVTTDTVIVTTTIGNLGSSGGTAVGKNVQFGYSGSAINVALFPDGTSGTATIGISTNSGITFPSKTFLFYSTSVSTLTVSPVSTTLAVGTNSSALIVVAKDASGNWINSVSNIYLFSDATGVVSETATNANCTAVAASKYAVCSLTGLVAGTANIVVGSSTAKANATTAYKVTVTSNPIASIAITSNKTSYAPGEKAYIRVTAKDSAGNSVAPQTISSFFASGGISTDVGLGAGSDTTTGTTVQLQAQTTTGYSTGDAVLQYTVYMPAGASSITFSATGGTGLPAAAQKAVSLTVNLNNSGSSAAQAVLSLTQQWQAFVTRLSAQITSLTDLIMRIQKKVKA